MLSRWPSSVVQSRRLLRVGHVSWERPGSTFEDASLRQFFPKETKRYVSQQQVSKETIKLEYDFFGEPVTFPTPPHQNAMAALDGCLLSVVSKGKSAVGGGGSEAGIEAVSAHSAAVAWAEGLRFAVNSQCPMLVVVTVAPLLVQAGVGYVHHLDSLLEHTERLPGVGTPQMLELARKSVSYKNDGRFEERERLHLIALECLLQSQHAEAMVVYLRILQSCPGDALALAQALDLAWMLGDKEAASSAVGSVAAYWNERRGGLVRPSLPGHAMVSSYVALGLAVNGRDEEAEAITERSMRESVAGALATWAQAHIFDARGRVAEGISALANFDGIRNYEGAGFLFFDCRLSGYGARFSLDREERGRGKSAALRLYESNFERVLNYSGFGVGQPWERPVQQAPLAWKDPTLLDDGKASSGGSSLFGRIFGREEKEDQESFDIVVKRINFPSAEVEDWDPTIEDVLTWLPPTPTLLADATLLLLRLTLNGTVSTRNARWDSIRNAWESTLEIQSKASESLGTVASTLAYSPMASIAASLLFDPSRTGGDVVGNGSIAEGFHRMGELMTLGNPIEESAKTTSIRELIADRDPKFWLPAENTEAEQWIEVVRLLRSGIEGTEDANLPGQSVDRSRAFRSWDFEARPILEHAVTFAACKAGDVESLSFARSVCGRGVTIRMNSPEEWWRYSIVLGLLGDEVGSEQALENSVNFGGGQGAR